jgi:hypothetical protein
VHLPQLVAREQAVLVTERELRKEMSSGIQDDALKFSPAL